LQTLISGIVTPSRFKSMDNLRLRSQMAPPESELVWITTDIPMSLHLSYYLFWRTIVPKFSDLSSLRHDEGTSKGNHLHMGPKRCQKVSWISFI